MQDQQHYIERAIADIRRGREVVITHHNQIYAVCSPEFLTEQQLNQLIKRNAKLVLTSARAQHILDAQPSDNITISCASQDIASITNLVFGDNKQSQVEYKIDDSLITKAVIHLAKLAELAPAVIIAECDFLTRKISMQAQAVLDYKNIIATELTKVVEADITLNHAPHAKIVGFRPTNGFAEHFAIVIGDIANLAKPPLIRVHSSNYTGDFLVELGSDCHQQLTSAIDIINKHGGGVILYLMQEGRGIGLINKLRAYQAQSRGMDTVQANQFIGFADDERGFNIAATMLKQLDIQKIDVLTNNPKKLDGLEQFGIEIANRVPHILATKDNADYLKTKAAKLGHHIKD